MKQPNIVFILSDQHNPLIGGYADDKWIDTPNLDRLAEEGVRFSQCYCNSPLCVPSRSSMLTGRLPTGTGVWNNLQCLRTDEPSFVSSLAVAGYETVLAGRMHFIGYDQRHGFEKRLVGDVAPTFPRPERQAALYGPLRGTPDQSRVSIERSGPGSSAMTFFDREVTEAACSFMERRRGDRPLFLMVGYANPHCPFVAPPELYKKYKRLLPAPPAWTQKDTRQLHPALQEFIRLRDIESVSSEESQRVRAAYYANIEYMDQLIGRLYASAHVCLGPDTIFIYASDHGEGLGQHGLYWKSNFYESSAKVPLIVCAPDLPARGVRIDEPVSLVDLAPTLLEWGDAPPLPAMDGRSLLPLVRGEDTWDQRPVISQLIDIKGDMPSAMIRRGRYKLIQYCTYPDVQLFDLKSDPGEDRDLGRDPAFAGIRQALQRELSAVWDEEKAIRTLELGRENAKLFKQWVKAAMPVCPDEWWTSADNNCLLDDR